MRAYLDQDAIIKIAQQSGAQAIHPGYGFLSENSEFIKKCEDTGIIFVGPPSHVVQGMLIKRTGFLNCSVGNGIACWASELGELGELDN